MKDLWKGIAILGIWGGIAFIGVNTTSTEMIPVLAMCGMVATIVISIN